jgi:hypothetical protein
MMTTRYEFTAPEYRRLRRATGPAMTGTGRAVYEETVTAALLSDLQG